MGVRNAPLRTSLIGHGCFLSTPNSSKYGRSITPSSLGEALDPYGDRRQERWRVNVRGCDLATVSVRVHIRVEVGTRKARRLRQEGAGRGSYLKRAYVSTSPCVSLSRERQDRSYNTFVFSKRLNSSLEKREQPTQDGWTPLK